MLLLVLAKIVSEAYMFCRKGLHSGRNRTKREDL
jgi:hypothetical protein